MTEFTHRFSLFDGARDPWPRGVELPWSRICDELLPHAFKGEHEKLDCLAFSPAAYPENTRRGKRYVLGASLWCGDHDGITAEELERLVDCALARSWALLVYSTWSHARKPGYSIRSVVPLSRVVTPEEWPEFWTIMNTVLGGSADPACKDMSRIYFAPFAPSGDEEAAFSHVWRGIPADVEELLSQTTTPHAASPPRARQEAPWRSSSDAVDAVRAAPHHERNNTLNRAAFFCARRGDDVRALLGEAAELAGLGAAEVERTIESGWDAGLAAQKQVIAVGPDLHRVVDEAVRALGDDATLYQRECQLVHVVRAIEPDGYGPAGTPQIRGVTAARLRDRLTHLRTWERFDARGKEWRATTPSRDIATMVVDRHEWPDVRPLVGVLETPSLRPDGTIIQTPGYDTATGWLYQPTCEYPRIADEPTRDDARAALRQVCEVWQDFPYARECERYVPTAAVLALVGRPAIMGCIPAHIFDASVRGAGKTLQADGVAIFATGRDAPRVSWRDSDEEIAKILGAYALHGSRLIAFDNVDTVFGGGSLDAVLTATDRVELRVLGRSEIATLRWRAVMLAGGNNIQLGADTTRRCLVSRLEPEVERPEERTGYAHPDLLGWLREERPRLVCAALTILRAHAVAGRPDMGVRRWGSYDAWREVIAGAIAWAGDVDVIECRASGDGERDPEAAALGVVLRELPRVAPDGCTARTLVETLWPSRPRLADAPDSWGTLRDALDLVIRCRPGTPPSARQVGYRLRAWRGRVIAGRRLASSLDRDGITIWRVDGAGDRSEHHPQKKLNVING